MARLTTKRLAHRRDLPRLKPQRPIRVYLIEKFKAKGVARNCEINGSTITITRPLWAQLLHPCSEVKYGRHKGERIQPKVVFTVDDIVAVRWRRRIGPFRPVMYLDVPGANDRWCSAGLWGGSRPHRIKGRLIDKQHVFWLALAILFLRPELRTHPWKGFPKRITGTPPARRPQGWWSRTFGTTTRYMRGEMRGARRRGAKTGRYKIAKPVRRTGGHASDHHLMRRSR